MLAAIKKQRQKEPLNSENHRMLWMRKIMKLMNETQSIINCRANWRSSAEQDDCNYDGQRVSIKRSDRRLSPPQLKISKNLLIDRLEDQVVMTDLYMLALVLRVDCSTRTWTERRHKMAKLLYNSGYHQRQRQNRKVDMVLQWFKQSYTIHIAQSWLSLPTHQRWISVVVWKGVTPTRLNPQLDDSGIVTTGLDWCHGLLMSKFINE